MSQLQINFEKPAGICQCCGQKIKKPNPHRMCKQKVSMLMFLARSGDWVKVQHGSGAAPAGESLQRVPYRAEAHASRLAWFGLAEHGPTRSGLYRITDNGIKFLAGKHEVPAVIFCKDGKVVGSTDNKVTISNIRGVVLDKEYWDNYPKQY